MLREILLLIGGVAIFASTADGEGQSFKDSSKKTKLSSIDRSERQIYPHHFGHWNEPTPSRLQYDSTYLNHHTQPFVQHVPTTSYYGHQQPPCNNKNLNIYPPNNFFLNTRLPPQVQLNPALQQSVPQNNGYWFPNGCQGPHCPLDAVSIQNQNRPSYFLPQNQQISPATQGRPVYNLGPQLNHPQDGFFQANQKPSIHQDGGFRPAQVPSNTQYNNFQPEKIPLFPQGNFFGPSQRPSLPQSNSFVQSQTPLFPQGNIFYTNQRPLTSEGDLLGPNEKPSIPQDESGSEPVQKPLNPQGVKLTQTQSPSSSQDNLVKPTENPSISQDDNFEPTVGPLVYPSENTKPVSEKQGESKFESVFWRDSDFANVVEPPSSTPYVNRTKRQAENSLYSPTSHWEDKHLRLQGVFVSNEKNRFPRHGFLQGQSYFPVQSYAVYPSFHKPLYLPRHAHQWHLTDPFDSRHPSSQHEDFMYPHVSQKKSQKNPPINEFPSGGKSRPNNFAPKNPNYQENQSQQQTRPPQNFIVNESQRPRESSHFEGGQTSQYENEASTTNEQQASTQEEKMKIVMPDALKASAERIH